MMIIWMMILMMILMIFVCFFCCRMGELDGVCIPFEVRCGQMVLLSPQCVCVRLGDRTPTSVNVCEKAEFQVGRRTPASWSVPFRV